MNIQDLSVLVIDDSSVMRMIIGNYLKNLGITEIIEAVSGKEALSICKEATDPFGLILCDWSMPEMNGYDFLLQLRENHALKYLKFCMITAEKEKAQMDKVNSVGIDGYLTKPFEEEEFKNYIMSVLRKSD